MRFPELIAAQRNVLRGRWVFVYPRLRPPRWWEFWKHRHRHRMEFRDDTYGRELDWTFVCRCGHETTDIEEAQP